MNGYKSKNISIIVGYILVVTVFYHINFHNNIPSNLINYKSHGALAYFKQIMHRGDLSILYFLGFPICAISITYFAVVYDVKEGFVNYKAIHNGKNKTRIIYGIKSFLYPFSIFFVYITLNLFLVKIIFSDSSIYGVGPYEESGVIFYLKVYSMAITMGIWGMIAYLFSYKCENLYKLIFKTMMSLIFVSFFMGAIVRNVLWFEMGLNIPFVENNDFLDLTMMINLDLMFTTSGWLMSVFVYIVLVTALLCYQYQKKERIV